MIEDGREICIDFGTRSNICVIHNLYHLEHSIPKHSEREHPSVKEIKYSMSGWVDG